MGEAQRRGARARAPPNAAAWAFLADPVRARGRARPGTHGRGGRGGQLRPVRAPLSLDFRAAGFYIAALAYRRRTHYMCVFNVFPAAGPGAWCGGVAQLVRAAES